MVMRLCGNYNQSYQISEKPYNRKTTKLKKLKLAKLNYFDFSKPLIRVSFDMLSVDEFFRQRGQHCYISVYPFVISDNATRTTVVIAEDYF